MKRKGSFLRCFAIVLVYSCLGIQQVSAQDWDHEYVPFVEEGKEWNCKTVRVDSHETNSIDCIFTISGDTLIDNCNYKKVLCEYEEFYGDKEQHYFCAVREIAYQVRFIKENQAEEMLLYDFGLPKDTLWMSYDDNEFARTRGHHRRYFPTRQYAYNLCAIVNGEVNSSYSYGFWIEGVGYAYGNPFEFTLERFNHKFPNDICVMSCRKGDELYFDFEWTAAPTSVSAPQTQVSTSEKLFDLQGRRILGEPKHGVYIQNGKKVIR